MLIFVYGPPGSGKSTVGRRLADILAMNFYDLDDLIRMNAGMDIPEIFSSEGEGGFRRRERSALIEALKNPSAVITLGGGALLDEENRREVERVGRVVCLQAPFEILWQRLAISADERPLISGDIRQKLAALLEGRASHYASFPLQVDTADISIEETAWETLITLGVFRVKGMGSGYDVHIRPGCMESIGNELYVRSLRSPIALVSDENVAGFYAARVEESLARRGINFARIVIPPGEAYKTVGTVSALWQAFLEAALERGSTVIALGGGVVGDLAGFAAATYLRGVPWVVLPTSLLAMADSSLGGKTGADLPQGKNLVGAFHPPQLVWADPQVLDTLPEVEFRSGLAEVVKAGVIADPTLFGLCAGGWQAVHSERDRLVCRAIAVKVRVIEADPFEKGLRAVLNLGHTVGHALEVASSYRLSHGSAVSVGMIVEARMAEKIGLAQSGLAEQIEIVLKNLNLPWRIPGDLDVEFIIKSMQVDKKRLQGSLRFTLPVRLGEVQPGVHVENIEVLQEALLDSY